MFYGLLTSNTLWVRPGGAGSELTRTKRHRRRAAGHVEVLDFSLGSFVSDALVIDNQVVGNGQLIVRVTV